ncbi:WD domain-containing protein [Ampelomyces quisqualis]|uniref:WD domain-containing protein n=1 Tax=Ampelomyces quisqualis TaxID=50730 RepID=A0A6A5QG43_AMPQU|nr:WD domain-containing protein [Ampelomyces quisqualis]
MSPTLHHECPRLPVTALASCGPLLVAAEGPFLRFYHAKSLQHVASERVFDAQAVHGVSVYSENSNDVIRLVVWGGPLVRALEISFPSDGHDKVPPGTSVRLSQVAKASDWILDLDSRFSSLEGEAEYQRGICVAVTAHNALVQVSIDRKNPRNNVESNFTLSIRELTSSSRSILYSAHVFYESENCVLVAAGTAFGEIMYWSWTDDPVLGSISRVHRVFLGHEGSIFGVRISKELPVGYCQSLKRIIASCSDDRTIRIWDVSDVAVRSPPTPAIDEATDADRTRHTGFSNAAFDPNILSSAQCLAIGWGHASRVWKVQFLESTLCGGAILLVSAGEDASSRTWKLTLDTREETILPYQLLEQYSAAHHSGKNIWSNTIYSEAGGRQQIACGAADAKITASPLVHVSHRDRDRRAQEYTVLDILALANRPGPQSLSGSSETTQRSSKQAEFFRSYCFLDHESFLLTTNSGNILVGSLKSSDESVGLNEVTFIDQPQDLKGYSISIGMVVAKVAFIAGSSGTIYAFSATQKSLFKLGSVAGKIGGMFTASTTETDGRKVVALLVILVGQKDAKLLYVDTTSSSAPCVVRTVIVPISESLTGSMVTGMSLIASSTTSVLHLGFRSGSIAMYSVSNNVSDVESCATLVRVLEKVHGDETVTALQWTQSSTEDFAGHLMSVGRDGRLAIHYVDLETNSVELVHNLTLPIGPSIEGMYLHQGQLLVHGFSSKRWVLYNASSEEEIMSVETGGAHRSWAYQSSQNLDGGGTLVWTRASSMHICGQKGSNHSVIRPGGHGREIKAVAVTDGPNGKLIATGAEDTDVKIFEYVGGEMLCRRTLRRHTTGVQHLQWSGDGEYLFSSGGCEEFYIWRIRPLSSTMGIGAVCCLTYLPESEHADLRIMSFDVQQHNSGFNIALVFSDSSVKLYRYTPAAAVKWQPLAKGLYFTSCLTQCLFLAPETIWTAGTDGHAVVWPLSSDVLGRPSDSTSSHFTMEWQGPVRIHQSSSKAMDTLCLDTATRLVVSGGDDGSLAILLARHTWSPISSDSVYAAAPVLVSRCHASAITACVILRHHDRILIMTSGNDQWIRLWEVDIRSGGEDTFASGTTSYGKRSVNVERVGKMQTNVADVSSIAVLEAEEAGVDARVLLCGVGMEVVRVEWD